MNVSTAWQNSGSESCEQRKRDGSFGQRLQVVHQLFRFQGTAVQLVDPFSVIVAHVLS
jgi:hypothetical protein